MSGSGKTKKTLRQGESSVVVVRLPELIQHRQAVEITVEHVKSYFSEFRSMNSRYEVSPIVYAAISGVLTWISKLKFDNNQAKYAAPEGRHYRAFLRDAKKKLHEKQELARNQDLATGEAGCSPHWLAVELLSDIIKNMELMGPDFDPPLNKRQAWHLAAAHIEDNIRNIIQIHHPDFLRYFSRSASGPFIRMIGHALEEMGWGTHAPETIREALASVPSEERPVIIVRHHLG